MVQVSSRPRPLAAVLAVLCRKGFGECRIKKAQDKTLEGMTFRQAYDAVEERNPGDFPQDTWDFRTDIVGGALVVYRTWPDESSQVWLLEDVGQK